jgi:hypothetical protein
MEEIKDQDPDSYESFLNDKTGFGSKNTCSLCAAVGGDCTKCIHSLNDFGREQPYTPGFFPCINDSYDALEDAASSGESEWLYEAINERAKYLDFLVETI